MSQPDVYLVVGDTSLADALIFSTSTGVANTTYAIPGQAVTLGSGSSFPIGLNFGAHERGIFRNQGGYTPPPGTEPVTFTVFCFGGATFDVPTAERDYRAIGQKLEQARRGAGAYNQNQRVCLWYRPVGTATFVFYDVMGGLLTYIDNGLPSAAPKIALLRLDCLPYPRSAPVVDAATSTITNGTSGAQIFRGAVPGDVDALLQMKLTDVSTNAKIIQRLRLGRRSARPMLSTDFKSLYDLTSKSPGADFTDASGVGGKVSRVVGSTAFQSLGSVNSAAGANQTGLFDLWAIVRDSSTVLGTPTWGSGATLPAVASGTGGALTPDLFNYILTAYDGSHNESFPTAGTSVQVPITPTDFFDDFESGDTSRWDGTKSLMTYTATVASTVVTQASAHTMPTSNASQYGLHSQSGTAVTSLNAVGTSLGAAATARSLVYKRIPGGGTSGSMRTRISINSLTQKIGTDSVLNRIPLVLDANFVEQVWVEGGLDWGLGFHVWSLQPAVTATPAFTSATTVGVVGSAPGLAVATYYYKMYFQNISIRPKNTLSFNASYGFTGVSSIVNSTITTTKQGVSLVWPSAGQDGFFTIFRSTAVGGTYYKLAQVASDVGVALGGNTCTWLDDGKVTISSTVFSAPGTDVSVVVPNLDLPMSEWMYFEVDVTPTTLNFYVNDVLTTSQSLSGSIAPYYLVCGTSSYNGGQSTATDPIGLDVSFDDVQMNGNASQIGANAGSVVLNWTAPDAKLAAPSGYYLYWQKQVAGGGSWRRVDLGNVLTYTHTSLTAGTVVSGPPTKLPVNLPALYRAGAAVQGAAVQNWLDPVSCQYSNGVRELLNLGPISLPPISKQEGQAWQPWYVEIQAQAGSTGTPNLDADYIFLTPHGDEQFVDVAWPDGKLATKAIWQIDTRYDGRVSCLLISAADGVTVLGQAACTGQFMLGPGDNAIITHVEVGDGTGRYVDNVVDAKYTVANTIRPAYVHSAGGG